MDSPIRIVIVGSQGQVGSELAALDWSAFGLDANSEIIALSRADLDISKLDSIHKIIETRNPHWVINASAYTAVDKAESDSANAYAVNAFGPEQLALACASTGARLIHISTDYVYPGEENVEEKRVVGDAGIVALSESDPVGPTGVYGASKLAGELLIKNACPEHIILRTAWVFGLHGNNFVKTMLRLGAERDELGVVADQWGGPTSARGIAMAIASIVAAVTRCESGDDDLSSLWGVYNFSGEPHVNWAQFAEAIFERATVLGVLARVPKVNSITSDQYPTPAKRPANSRLSNDKVSEVFGIAPDDWQAAVDELLIDLKPADAE
jgi:dTDP-4-dehydrorhamnose reductase